VPPHGGDGGALSTVLQSGDVGCGEAIQIATAEVDPVRRQEAHYARQLLGGAAPLMIGCITREGLSVVSVWGR
jgi:hypothetical protein